jgi:hypothetical protein
MAKSKVAKVPEGAGHLELVSRVKCLAPKGVNAQLKGHKMACELGHDLSLSLTVAAKVGSLCGKRQERANFCWVKEASISCPSPHVAQGQG